VGTGVVATTLLESSSVTIIMVIALVSRGALSFVQSLGVVCDRRGRDHGFPAQLAWDAR